MKVIIAIATVGIVAAGAVVALNYNNIATKISEAVNSFKSKNDELTFPKEDTDEF